MVRWLSSAEHQTLVTSLHGSSHQPSKPQMQGVSVPFWLLQVPVTHVVHMLACIRKGIHRQ